MLDVTFERHANGVGPVRTDSFHARALPHLNHRPLPFCMYRLPPSFGLRLAERRPVMLVGGRRRSLVPLASRHLHVLERTPRRAERALLRLGRRPGGGRVRKPVHPLSRETTGTPLTVL